MNTEPLKMEDVPAAIHEMRHDLKRIESLVSLGAVEKPCLIKDAAEFVGLKVPTIYKLVQEKKIPFHRKDRKIFFLKSELLSWIKLGPENNTAELADNAIA